MVMQRRPTPTTSQVKEQLSVLGSLSAWTEDPEEEGTKKKVRLDGYKPLEGDEAEVEPTFFSTYVSPLLDSESNEFSMIIGVVIILNAIVIGFETDYGRGNFVILEHFFNACFFVEMCMRMYQLRFYDYFTESWNLFDFALVTTGTLDLWVLPALTGSGSAIHGLTSLRLLRMVRMLRLMRVLRVVRLFRMFSQLNLILQAFKKAFQVVILISVLVCILNYACAIILTQVVGHHHDQWDKEDQERIILWFGDIPSSMRTLFVVMTLSNWEEIVVVVGKVFWGPGVFMSFLAYIVIASYTMVSLITAIICESLIAAQNDFRHRKLHQIEESRENAVAYVQNSLMEILGDELDKDGATVGADIKQAVKGDPELHNWLRDCQISMTDKGIATVIDKMSLAGSEGLPPEGQPVNVEWFCDRLCSMTGDAKGKQVADVKHLAKQAMVAAKDCAARCERLEEKVAALDAVPEQIKDIAAKLDQLLKK
eukprot:TRINITY_DN81884_c0_g1_i1.p1 TRINITY_DN81884_c0_g1~~TRINITY_DN81884_c0_g1_i1.p1  ORF type:complete len:481 (+),score=144.92 TRINITY_DN81884_c0_g1_i1:126-1568(+)